MAVSYNRLWKLLVDRKMSKADLRKQAAIAPNTLTKLRRDKEVTLEVFQAENYVRQIKKSGILHKTSNIHAFVVGCEIGDIDVRKVSDSGTVDVLTYGHLVETANAKLFGLKQTLEEHYNSFNDESLVEKALKELAQMKIKL